MVLLAYTREIFKSNAKQSSPNSLSRIIGVALAQGALLLLMVNQGWNAWDHHVIGLEGDSSIYLWFLSWWGHALSQGLALAHTGLISYPWGNNTLWDTSVPLIFIPLSLLYHAHIVSLELAYNIATFGGWWFSGISAYWSFSRITGHAGASALGSTLTLTGAYFANQALGHTDLMWVGFSFILFAILYDFVRTPRPTRWLMLRVLPLLAGLWLTNQEYFVTTQIMVAMGLYGLVHQAIHRRRRWTEVTRVLKSYAKTLLAGATVLLPLVLWQLCTPNQPFRPFSYINVYQINLANFLVPVHTWLHWGAHVSLTGNVMEQDGYLGLIFLAGLAWFSLLTYRRWQAEHGGVLVWTGAIILLAMGDSLLISAHANSGIPLPGVILSVVPILKDIIFDRFMWGAFWGIGLLSALVFIRLQSIKSRILFAAWAALVVMTWWPRGYPVLTLRANPWITSMVETHAIKPGEAVLVFPYDCLYNPNNNVLYTQIANHFRYRLLGGYLTPNDADLQHENALITYWTSVQLYGPNSTAARWYGSLGPGPRVLFKQYLTKARPQLVVLTAMAHEIAMEQWLTSTLGPPSGQSGSTFYWNRPRE